MCVVTLRDNREPGLRYLLAITNRRRALPWLPQSGCMFVLCTGVIPVEACGYNSPLLHFLCTSVTPVEECGHCSPHPPLIFVRGPGCSWNCVLSLHVVGHPEESITFLRLMVAVSSRLFLVPEGVGLMPVISVLSPLYAEHL